jgi:hypothetical protein
LGKRPNLICENKALAFAGLLFREAHRFSAESKNLKFEAALLLKTNMPATREAAASLDTIQPLRPENSSRLTH